MYIYIHDVIRATLIARCRSCRSLKRYLFHTILRVCRKLSLVFTISIKRLRFYYENDNENDFLFARCRCSRRRNGSDESFIVNEIFPMLKMIENNSVKNRLKEHNGRSGLLLHFSIFLTHCLPDQFIHCVPSCSFHVLVFVLTS